MNTCKVCGEEYKIRLRDDGMMTTPIEETRQQHQVHKADSMYFLHQKED
jgi:hypothetical protein